MIDFLIKPEFFALREGRKRMEKVLTKGMKP